MEDVPILIVAQAGRWRDSLQVLLRAIAGIELLPPAESLASALPLLARHASMVVVLDFSLPGDEAWSLLQHLKQDYPQARCLALIESEAQKQLVQAAGADNVLLAGFTLEMLQTALAQILENLQVELSDEALDQVAGGLDSFNFPNIEALTDTFKLAGDKW